MLNYSFERTQPKTASDGQFMDFFLLILGSVPVCSLCMLSRTHEKKKLKLSMLCFALCSCGVSLWLFAWDRGKRHCAKTLIYSDSFLSLPLLLIQHARLAAKTDNFQQGLTCLRKMLNGSTPPYNQLLMNS